MKKLYITMIIFTIITLLSSMVFATTTSKFEVVDDQVCTIKINDYCSFEKKMVSYDLDKRQVTIQLKITNDAPVNQPVGEVMLLLDNSASMQDETSAGSIRGNLVFNSAKTLVQKMLTGNDNLKVGIARFSTNTDFSKEGTIDDSSLVSELSNDVSALTSAIDSIQMDGPRTDLDAGLTLASQHFTSENNNKYLIVLTDGVPNVALQASDDYYGANVISKTKAKLQSLQANNINVITMLTGINDPNQQAGFHDYTFQYVIDSIFGTTSNPTAGKFYYITDNQIEQTITNEIYSDLLPTSQSITDIKINDFFPQYIIDNFDFAYISEPTKGTISSAIDDERKIVWSIDELASGETATVQYTLTLKDNYDPDIVGVILDTNEKVTITYKDFDGTDGSKTSDETPKVRITETVTPEPAPEPEPEPDTPEAPKVEPKKDTTVAPTILPKTGSVIMLSGISLSSVFAAFSGIKLHGINKKMR